MDWTIQILPCWFWPLRTAGYVSFWTAQIGAITASFKSWPSTRLWSGFGWEWNSEMMMICEHKKRQREREGKKRKATQSEKLWERERDGSWDLFFFFFRFLLIESFVEDLWIYWIGLFITVNSDFRWRRNHLPANYGWFLVMRDEINLADIADSVEEQRSKDG